MEREGEREVYRDEVEREKVDGVGLSMAVRERERGERGRPGEWRRGEAGDTRPLGRDEGAQGVGGV